MNVELKKSILSSLIALGAFVVFGDSASAQVFAPATGLNVVGIQNTIASLSRETNVLSPNSPLKPRQNSYNVAGVVNGSAATLAASVRRNQIGTALHMAQAEGQRASMLLGQMNTYGIPSPSLNMSTTPLGTLNAPLGFGAVPGVGHNDFLFDGSRGGQDIGDVLLIPGM